MRKVKFKKAVNGIYEDDYSHEGLFHQWGVDYDEMEIGAGNYTFAIVELKDGTMAKVLPEHLKFDDKL